LIGGTLLVVAIALAETKKASAASLK